MVKSMTEGSPSRHILSFTAPLLLGNLFQQFYNIVDTAIVGKFLGKQELAAVGATGSLMFLILGFVMGICTGFGIVVSRYFGAGDEKSLRRSVANIIYLAGFAAVALTVFSSLATGWLLEIMGTPSDISDFAYDYIHVIFTYGIISSMFYNVLANVLRALGDSKTPLYFLIIASVCNVVLDLFFILVCGMGVEGAAVATVLSQFISGGLCIVYMIKKFPILRLTREDMPFSGSMSVRLVGQGLPMALQFSITAVGSVILQSAVNSLGSDAVAAVTAANKVQLFVSQPMESIGITMAAGLFELAARACVALVFVGKFGYAAICYSGPAAWVAADVLLIPMLFVTLRLVRKHLDKDRSQQPPAAYGQTGAGGGDICGAGGDACEGIS